MSIWGKIIGGAAGFAIGGPLGGLLGAVAGHVYDARKGDEESTREPEKAVAFTVAVIALGAKLAKADGVVTKAEVAAFREVFHVAPEETRNVARVFNLARKHAHGYESYARQVAGMFAHNPAVLEELVDCLFHIARADGKVSQREIHYIENVARIFGFSDADFRRIRSANIGPDHADPYEILGVDHSASDKEIRAAYRKLVRENHPDRLIAQGMPEDFVAVANGKLAAINHAYERVERERAGGRA
ncbi:MAG: TerB family tellurite resistance protein [Alphaproteobacteria bacterium]